VATQSRKLVAILAADIAGYSALMGSNEARTVSDLKSHQAVILPMLGQFGGRLIDTAGDGIVAEFSSVVSALECAVAIQNPMAQRNAPLEPSRRMQFRMGVNIGDVIYDAERIYGEGINIAARLEGIAEPGGVYVSRQAYDQVEGKLPLSWTANPEKHREAGRGLCGRRYRGSAQHCEPRPGENETGGQVLPVVRWRPSRLCNLWKGAPAGKGRKLPEPPRI